MAPSNTNKKRSEKGKPLSESLRAKDEKKAAEASSLAADLAAERASAEGIEAEPGSAEADDEEADSDEVDSESEDAVSDDEDAERDEDADDDDESDEEPVAVALGIQRYVGFAFVALWLVVGFIVSRALREGLGELNAWPAFTNKAAQSKAIAAFTAIPNEGEFLSLANLSMALGATIGGLIVLHYYRRPDVRQWADDVADEVSKVKWPTRKEVGNYTVIVIAGSALLTAYLTLLDRFWSFVTNLIYSTGA